MDYISESSGPNSYFSNSSISVSKLANASASREESSPTRKSPWKTDRTTPSRSIRKVFCWLDEDPRWKPLLWWRSTVSESQSHSCCSDDESSLSFHYLRPATLAITKSERPPNLLLICDNASIEISSNLEPLSSNSSKTTFPLCSSSVHVPPSTVSRQTAGANFPTKPIWSAY